MARRRRTVTNETPKVVIQEVPKEPPPHPLSAQTLAEMEAGRQALLRHQLRNPRG